MEPRINPELLNDMQRMMFGLYLVVKNYLTFPIISKKKNISDAMY